MENKEKIDKGKLGVTIVIGIVCFVLIYIMFAQFNTINNTDVESIKSLRETELKTQISMWNTRIEELEKKYDETITKMEEYKNTVGTNDEAIELLEAELENLKTILGLTDVNGPGIIITLENNDEKSIESNDLLELVNELRLAGAEAISINNERVIFNSEIVDVDYRFIFVNGQRLTAPFVVKAIGNQVYLESELTTKQYGYIDNMTIGLGKTVKLDRKDNIKINKYEGEINFKYVK